MGDCPAESTQMRPLVPQALFSFLARLNILQTRGCVAPFNLLDIRLVTIVTNFVLLTTTISNLEVIAILSLVSET